MIFTTLRKIFRFGALSGYDLPNVSHLQIPNNVIDAGVTPRQCLAHLYLLEQFVSAKTKVQKWAEYNQVSPESAWNFYVNMAIERMQRWFLESYQADLRQAIPPLDVLLVWHALLQNPYDYDSFMQATGANLGTWNWDLLLSMVENAETGRFEPPRRLDDFIRQLYPFPNLLELLDVSTSFLQSRCPDRTTDHVVHLFLHKQRVHRFATHSGYVNFHFDFHSAIDKQLEFANRILQHSWHRMHLSSQGEGLQLRASIERYNKFMSLVQFSSDIQCLEVCMGRRRFFVPTLDIDLVWRTHMLCPQEFRLFSREVAGGIIKHSPSLRHFSSFDERTSTLYKHVFGEDYVVCLCWHCVHSRDVRSFPPPSWTAKPTFEEELSEEMTRRATAVIELPLRFGTRQCNKCGSHPNRQCRAKDALKGDGLQSIPPIQLESVRRRRTIRERTLARLAQTPWAQICSGLFPQPSSRRPDRASPLFYPSPPRPCEQRYLGRQFAPHASFSDLHHSGVGSATEMLFQRRSAARLDSSNSEAEDAQTNDYIGAVNWSTFGAFSTPADGPSRVYRHGRQGHISRPPDFRGGYRGINLGGQAFGQAYIDPAIVLPDGACMEMEGHHFI